MILVYIKIKVENVNQFKNGNDFVLNYNNKQHKIKSNLIGEYNVYNLSLAIGKKGLNVRLASRLTHYKLDVKTVEQVKESGINILE